MKKKNERFRGRNQLIDGKGNRMQTTDLTKYKKVLKQEFDLLYDKFNNDLEIFKILTMQDGKQIYFVWSNFIDFVNKYGTKDIIEKQILFRLDGEYKTNETEQN